MSLLLLLLFFRTLLHQSLGQNAFDSEEEQAKFIDKINDIRREVQPTASNMLKMEWSKAAAESAKKWAKKCQQSSSPNRMRHVNGRFCGESRMFSTYAISLSEMLDTWNARRLNFQYGVGAIDSNKDIYGYTQLIWYNTHEIGCAVARCEVDDNKYSFFYVCRTCPAGNIKQLIATPYKAGSPCEDCHYACEDDLCTNPCSFRDEKRDCRNLLDLFDCSHPWIKRQCKATCECKIV